MKRSKVFLGEKGIWPHVCGTICNKCETELESVCQKVLEDGTYQIPDGRGVAHVGA